ncbi:MAG: hypothetical protein H8E44_18435 [Planctomycetes bacterium]|nr:hypothetical protein [Planctomycetota bacterium]MBL7041877.1 hypothetical protein [Pirellulaceae bacterium]
MPTLSESLLFWIVVALQVAGVASVAIAQVSERSWARSVFQHAFFVCLVAVGLATMFAIYLRDPNWLPCAATLGLMSVGATLDLGSHRSAVEF